MDDDLDTTPSDEEGRDLHATNEVPHPDHQPLSTPLGLTDTTVVHRVRQIFKDMYDGVWATSSQIPKADMDLMFERFQNFYRWHHTLQQTMQSGFEGVVDRRMPDIMRRTRHEAIARARPEGRDPDRDGLSVIRDYSPNWIDQAVWDQLVDGVWATEAWQAKSAAGKRNRSSTTDGVMSKHTGGSAATVQHRFRLERELGREPTLSEVYIRTHFRRTTEADGSVSYGDFVTPMGRDTYERYQEAMAVKHPDPATRPLDDPEVWEAVVPRKKDRIYGFGVAQDPEFAMTGTPSTPSIGHLYTSGPSSEVLDL